MDLFLGEVPYQAAGQKPKEKSQKSKVTSNGPRCGSCDAGPGAGRNDFILFSESNSRFIVEVDKRRQKAFEKILDSKRVPYGLIGCVSRSEEFKVYGLDGKICVRADINELKESWQKPLRW